MLGCVGEDSQALVYAMDVGEGVNRRDYGFICLSFELLGRSFSRCMCEIGVFCIF